VLLAVVEVFVLVRRQSVESGLDAAWVVPAVMATEGRPYQPRAASLVIETGAFTVGVGADHASLPLGPILRVVRCGVAVGGDVSGEDDGRS
jgi:hypothetical protein